MTPCNQKLTISRQSLSRAVAGQGRRWIEFIKVWYRDSDRPSLHETLRSVDFSRGVYRAQLCFGDGRPLEVH
jgi:hypothetical protein